MAVQSPPKSRDLRNKHREELRGACKLDSKFISLQEDIYKRIASELHDSTCQHLVAASLNIMLVTKSLSDPQRVERLCEQLDASVNQALKELRSLTYLLYPHSLEEGLKTAIEQYADGFATRTSLLVEIEISPAVDGLSYEKQRSLFRIVQEALTNVYRHARATKVEITLEVTGRHFELKIRDNGQGRAVRDGVSRFPSPSPGTGIRIMQARLQEMGGTLEILFARTTRRRGTILRASFPYGLAIEPGERRPAIEKRC
jgi:two-component system NarL family sensor kinase